MTLEESKGLSWKIRRFLCCHMVLVRATHHPHHELWFISAPNPSKNLDSYFSLLTFLHLLLPLFLRHLKHHLLIQALFLLFLQVFHPYLLIPLSQLFLYLVPPLLLHPSLFSHKILSLLTLLHLLQSPCLYPTLSQSIPTLCKQGLNLVFTTLDFTLHFFSLILSLKL